MDLRQKTKDRRLPCQNLFWVKITSFIVAELFLFSSISPTFASLDHSRSHLRAPSLRASDGGQRFLLKELQGLEGNPLEEARVLAAQIGEGDLNQRIARLTAILTTKGNLDSPPEKWLPILVYALAPNGQGSSLYTEVEKNQEELFEQCRSCGISLLHQAPQVNSRLPQPDDLSKNGLDLLGALATAIDAVSHGGLIKTHPVTKEVMHSAFALGLLMNGHVGRVVPIGEELDRIQLFLKGEGFFMAQVKDQDPQGDHFVQIKEIKNYMMKILDRGEEKSIRREDFLKQWTGVVLSPHGALILDAVSESEAREIYGCCGIISIVGKTQGLRKAIDALARLAYRAPDNTGVAIVDEHGIQIRKVQGKPADLLYELYRNPLYREEVAFTITEEEVGAQREDLLKSENLRLTKPLIDFSKKREGPSVKNGEPITIEDIFNNTVDVGVGVTGAYRFGEVYQLGDAEVDGGEEVSTIRKYTNLRDLIGAISHEVDVPHRIATLFVKFELFRGLEDKISDLTERQEKAESLGKAFDRLIDPVLQGQRLDSEDLALWNEIMEIVRGRRIQVTADFNQDPVRYVFHLLSALIGTFIVHPHWEKEVRVFYNALILQTGAKLDPESWRAQWTKERRLNTPGLAFQALVQWFQTKMYAEGKIPDNVWWRQFSKPAKRPRLGWVDRITAGLLVEITEAHGRWAMTGDTRWFNAHPHREFGRETDREGLRVITHNGAVEPKINSTVRKEHEEKGYSYSSREGNLIQTDTKTIIEHWEMIFNDRQARRLSKTRRENWKTFQEKLYPRPDQLNADQQLQANDEIALRLALHELNPGSEIAISTFSLYSPFTKYIASHDRPLAIVEANGEVMVTSDENAALGLWPPSQVEKAEQDIRDIQREGFKEIDAFRERLEEKKLSSEEFLRAVSGVVVTMDKQIREVEERFKAKIINLDKEHKFVKIFKFINPDGTVSIEKEITTVDGTSLSGDPKLQPKERVISPAQGDKTGFNSFMAKHISEIPLIALKNASRYVDAEGKVNLAKETDVHGVGLNMNFLRENFGKDFSRLKNVYLVGIGSSWRDAQVVKGLYEQLLPDATIHVYDPVEMQIYGIRPNPQTDLAIGISWSGATSIMVNLFDRLKEEGTPIVAITGKPQSDLGRSASESGGTVDVQSGVEVTIATTKGFHSVLYVLSLLAVQLSELTQNGSLSTTREQVIQDLKQIAISHLPELVLKNKDMDLDRKDSLIRRIGQRDANKRKILIIGSHTTSPVIDEGELKAEEIRWGVGKAVDFNDASWRNTLRSAINTPEEEQVAVVVNATDTSRLDEAIQVIEELKARNVDFVVQTLDIASVQEDHYVREKIGEIYRKAANFVFAVPKVNTPLQGLIDSIFFFKYAVAISEASGLSSEEIDNSRNLAKSVTVSGAKEVTRQAKSLPFTMEQYASDLPVTGTSVLQSYPLQIKANWSKFEPRLQAILRLPLVLEGASRLALSSQTWNPILQKAQQLFGNHLEGLQKIVIVTNEEATYQAALAAKGPLSALESVSTGKEILKNPVDLRIRGTYYRITKQENGYTLQPLSRAHRGEEEVWEEVGDPIFLKEDSASITLAGNTYQVKHDTSGLTLISEAPHLLGVPVLVFPSTDPSLLRHMDPGTLLVPISRSTYRGAKEGTVVPIESLANGRSDAQLELLRQAAESEGHLAEIVGKAEEKGAKVLNITDPLSFLLTPLNVRTFIGSVLFDRDVDDTSLFGITYLNLLGLGIQLGKLKGIETAIYEKALLQIPSVAAQVVTDASLWKRIEEIGEDLVRYDKVHAVGGGQANADAGEMARLFGTQGIFAEPQLNDSAWHGPLAAVDPKLEKFANRERKSGVNSYYDPVNDTFIVFLGTDSRFFSATLTDVQVYNSRNGRFVLVIKKSDQKEKAVLEYGPFAYKILTIPDVPDELSNVANAVLSNMLTYGFAEAKKGGERESVMSKLLPSASDGGAKTPQFAQDGGVKEGIPEVVQRIASHVPEEKLDLVKPEELRNAIVKAVEAAEGAPYLVNLSVALARELLVNQEKPVSPMSFSADLYRWEVEHFNGPLYLTALVVSTSRLLDPRLNRGSLLDLLERSEGHLFFTEPREELLPALVAQYGDILGALQRQKRFVSSDLKQLSGIETTILLLDGKDRATFKVENPERLLAPIFIGHQRAFVVPLNAPVDIERELYLGTSLVSQTSLLGDLENLDATTKLILAEVAKGFGKAEKLMATMQREMKEAESVVTTVLKGL